MPIQVLPSFELPAGTTKAFFKNNYYQAADDLTLIRGRHQLGVGGSVAFQWVLPVLVASRRDLDLRWQRQRGGPRRSVARTRHLRRAHGAAQSLPVHGWYVGFYGQDTWRTERVTFNLGLRWEPYLGTSESGAVYSFNHDNFLRGVKSKVFVNAPRACSIPETMDFRPDRPG